jgi:hypothetical protein
MEDCLRSSTLNLRTVLIKRGNNMRNVAERARSDEMGPDSTHRTCSSLYFADDGSPEIHTGIAHDVRKEAHFEELVDTLLAL